VGVQSLEENEKIIIEIRDNGLGIDLDKYANGIFVPYKRFHHHVDGKGLGLYLVKTQVETLGGTLEVNSEVGTGTIFKMKFKKP
jgi:signal transduction histidine kinase